MRRRGWRPPRQAQRRAHRSSQISVGRRAFRVGSAGDLRKQSNELSGDHARAMDSPADFKAVFFGAAFGEVDTFVTPLGDLYGVEIHAAAFLSLLDPLSANNHLSEFLADIVFGFLFGFLIASCWEQYFKLRLSQTPTIVCRADLAAEFLVWRSSSWRCC